MSKFEDEYAKLRLKLDNVGKMMTHDVLLLHFKDWQAPKQVDEGQLYYVDFVFSSEGTELKDKLINILAIVFGTIIVLILLALSIIAFSLLLVLLSKIWWGM